MTRLTAKDAQGNWALKGVRWEDLRDGETITKELWERIYGALWRLMEYEDTGLDPDEVEELNDFSRSQVGKTMKKIAEEREKTRWILVGERLPEKEYETVIAVDKDNYYFVAVYNQKFGFRTKDIGGDTENIIAWRPLPETYRP